MIPTSPAPVGTTVPAQATALVRELAATVRGAVALPGSQAYERLTSGFNSAVQLTPLAVVEALDAYDVATAVQTAGSHGTRVGVSSTGHGARAAMDGALLVHTGRLDECTVHPEGWARVGAGTRWRALLDAAAPHGLTGLAGSSSGVGVVGYTTGGGIGPTARTYGVASDRVRALDVVTGRGRLVRATPDEHADLFWGLRGGRGCLGIVTALELDLVPLRTVYGGSLHFAGADAGAVLHAWRTWSAGLPTTVTTSVALQQLPPLPHVPPQLAGRPTIAVRFVHVGDAAEGARLLAPLRAVAPPVLDTAGELGVEFLDQVHRDPAGPVPSSQTAGLLRALPAEAVDALLRVAGPGRGSPLGVVELRQLGGAVSVPGPHPSAVCHRDAAFTVSCIGLGLPPAVDGVRARAAAVLEALAPWVTGGTLPNFGGTSRAYEPATLDRLHALVALHDPGAVLLAADDLHRT